MSPHYSLHPELQKLVDDFTSVRMRTADLVKVFTDQELQLQTLQTKLKNANKDISAMKQIKNENDRLTRSYEQLKRDYDVLYSSNEKHRDELRKENRKQIQDLEVELRAARAKISEQSELHQKSITQIVVDYESKLRDANEKIRHLTQSRHETSEVRITEDNPFLFPKSLTTPRNVNKKWPELAVEIKSQGSATRGRGRGKGKGTGSKRKLFVSNNDIPMDI
ncbi:uncharacterized protein LOC107217606 [Neodiprion lecontei]|uniref:Uncharacterized protein LOC107217606 n=1 Tax=Neodiprion lecontei TaxID=441921 RepID=A0A6J0BAG6_NEOLC|nr:uncharacterized protein LOC107217606 [Neodiprion lecontei]